MPLFKNPILSLSLAALTLLSADAYARERAFRAVSGTAIPAAFAIGWGPKAGNLDFEALDKLKDPERYLIENGDSLSNFLVDLETDSILDVVKSPAIMGRLGERYIPHSHDSLGLVEIPLEFRSDAEFGMAVIENYKWHNHIQKLVIVERDANGSKAVFESNSFGTDLGKAIMSRLSPAERKKYLDYNGAATWSFRTIDGPNEGYGMAVDAEIIRPKQDDPALHLSAKVQVKRTAEGVSIKVISAKLK